MRCEICLKVFFSKLKKIEERSSLVLFRSVKSAIFMVLGKLAMPQEILI